MCVRKISAQCVLQFTPNLAAGCVLHRPVSRVIHCSELFFVCFSVLGDLSLRSVCVRDIFSRQVTSPVEGRSSRGHTRSRSCRSVASGRDLEARIRDRGSLEAEEARWTSTLRAWHSLASTPCAEVAAGNRHLTDSRKCVRTADGAQPGAAFRISGSFVSLRRRRPDDGNDPIAGSPTITLLRLLLPLNDQVRSSFRHAAATRRPLRAPVRRPH